jgi:hypothetical protein
MIEPSRPCDLHVGDVRLQLVVPGTAMTIELIKICFISIKNSDFVSFVWTEL